MAFSTESICTVDIYKYDLDCQWIDITDIPPGEYYLKVAAPYFTQGLETMLISISKNSS